MTSPLKNDVGGQRPGGEASGEPSGPVDVADLDVPGAQPEAGAAEGRVEDAGPSPAAAADMMEGVVEAEVNVSVKGSAKAGAATAKAAVAKAGAVGKRAQPPQQQAGGKGKAAAGSGRKPVVVEEEEEEDCESGSGSDEMDDKVCKVRACVRAERVCGQRRGVLGACCMPARCVWLSFCEACGLGWVRGGPGLCRHTSSSRPGRLRNHQENKVWQK